VTTPSGPEERLQVPLLLVEDDAMVRRLLRLALEDSEFQLAGEALSAAEAHRLIERRRSELLLVDYRLPDLNGTELVREFRRAGVTTPALLMTANAERGFNELVREAGAQGTVLKTGHTDALLAALRTIAGGGESFDPRHPSRHPGDAALTPREREVLQLISQGASNREAAGALNVSAETVKTLLARACAKLGVARRAEAVVEARDRGLL
jgi:DNA-binding NarL/FixJ family response regulator